MHAPLRAHEHTYILCVNIHAHTQAWGERAGTFAHLCTCTHKSEYTHAPSKDTFEMWPDRYATPSFSCTYTKAGAGAVAI